MNQMLSTIIPTLTFTASVLAVAPPRVVGVPPADAGRGLVRVSSTEIRHYPGKGGTQYLQSLDNGESWSQAPLPDQFPAATCLAKEAPSIARNPNHKQWKYLRVEPLYRGNQSEAMHVALKGIDDRWSTLTNKVSGEALLPSGILRTPTWVNENKRILIPAHGGGCWTWYSDDQGASWQRSNKINAPAHELGGVHQGTRWNHGMVEASIVELRDKRLWMIARTARDQHYQSFSSDFGETWRPAEPSRFWGTITMPTIKRLNDERLLLLWSNTGATSRSQKGKAGRW